jgi:hypothetical protein
MPSFSQRCPHCGSPTVFEANRPCEGCGFSLPSCYASGNVKYRKKYYKHTNPLPSGNMSGVHSWCASGAYPDHQNFCYESGSAYWDPMNGYVFLWAPLTSGQYADIQYPLSGSSECATGCIMPLNSKLQHLHHFNDHLQPHFIKIADGKDLMIRMSGSPNAGYEFYQSGRRIANFHSASGLITY